MILGLIVFLTIHYSFLVAFGVMYSGGMLLLTMIAFSARRKEPKEPRALNLNDEAGEKIVERQTASLGLKIA